jgi:DNA-binding HxlR family transcriptional regulator
VEYWDTLLKRLKVFRAKAKLKEIHTNLLKKKLADLEEQQLLMREPRREDASSPEPTSPTPSATTATTSAETPSEWDNLEHAQRNRNVEEDEDAGSYSPDLVHSIDGGEEVVDPEDDAAVLAEQRKQVLNIEAKRLRIRASDLGRNPADRVLTEDEMYRMEAEKAMEESEEQFNIEVPLENKVYWWHDKYRPRKPKFFNRVHTGYEWNKYNQTHYDHDNPPPKVVQGYKFNIFYPDLIDKTKAPQYFIQPGPTPDTCTLRIHAGPPYEDIAFRIVNREWEYSHKKGFKCTFERGILHLWFNFKRYRYRR